MSINPLIIAISWQLRWSVYQRLTSIGIPCHYQPHQPLVVEVNSPTAAVQVWSVVRQMAAPRQTLVEWLERCWRYQDELARD